MLNLLIFGGSIFNQFCKLIASTHFSRINAMYPNDEEKLSYGRQCLQKKARDNSRTPMQWDSTANAGFCSPTVTPWMRLNDDFTNVNAEAQLKYDGGNRLSVLQFWKKALSIRKANLESLVYGGFELANLNNEDIFAYTRSSDGEKWIIALNFNERKIDWQIPSQCLVKKWLFGNYTDSLQDKPLAGSITLQPWEGVWGKYTLE